MIYDYTPTRERTGPEAFLQTYRGFLQAGAPRTVKDAQVAALITRTLETTPRAGTHGSTRAMAKATGLSQSAVSRIWRAFSLQPHR